MAVVVKYFASLRERMGRSEERVDLPAPASVAEVWERVAPGASLPGNTLVAVNMEYADRDRLVRDGDEVAFFPPVTGGRG
jgi:molybdopterin synthase sulfur carrier subunit